MQYERVDEESSGRFAPLLSCRNKVARLVYDFLCCFVCLQTLKLQCPLRVKEKEPERETGKQERSESLFEYNIT